MDTPRDLDNLFNDDPRSGARRSLDRFLTWARHGENWTKVGIPATVAVVGLALAGGLLWLLWLLLCAIGRGITATGHGIGHGGNWLISHMLTWGIQLWHWASGPLAHTISNPIHHYLHTHATGLPMSGGQAFTLWIVTLCVTWGLATLHESGAARIGWILVGALTVAGVYAGTTGDAKTTAAAITIAAWGLASLTVFTRSWQRLTFVNIHNTITKTSDDQ